MRFAADSLHVTVVCFEGPDQYSLSGGLGVRVRDLTRAFAAMGYEVCLVFVGDPHRPAFEEADGVQLRRVAQDVSRHFPAGVYEGEREKVEHLTNHLPGQLVHEVIEPALRRGKNCLVLSEEWHTTHFVRALHEHLIDSGHRQEVMLLWNANNHFGFEEIDWFSLNQAATITTVSRYMKHLMWPYGVNPVVIPNGIDPALLSGPVADDRRRVRLAAETACLVFKIGRFSPDKRWHQALAAVAELRHRGTDIRLLMRGGIEPYGKEVLADAARLDLQVAHWTEPVSDAQSAIAALQATLPAAVINLSSFLPNSVIPLLAASADAVLANSGHEPFGLVGIEAMASGGVAIVGATGEDYARSYGNSIVIESDDPEELVQALLGLMDRPPLVQHLRLAGQRDAADFAWPRVLDGLLERLRFVAIQQNLRPVQMSGQAVAGSP